MTDHTIAGRCPACGVLWIEHHLGCAPPPTAAGGRTVDGELAHLRALVVRADAIIMALLVDAGDEIRCDEDIDAWIDDSRAVIVAALGAESTYRRGVEDAISVLREAAQTWLANVDDAADLEAGIRALLDTSGRRTP